MLVQINLKNGTVIVANLADAKIYPAGDIEYTKANTVDCMGRTATLQRGIIAKSAIRQSQVFH